MQRRFTILDGVEARMRDGTILRGDVWLPDGPGPFPVLLQRTPYRREDVHGAQYIASMEFQQALRHGLAVMVQDTRGRHGSDGTFTPFAHEAADGADTITWLRQQSFCDGRVGMFGASYVGATQVLVAADNPEGLLAISPQLTTARHGETWTYKSGAVELSFLMQWVIEALAPPDLPRRKPGLAPDAAADLDALISELLADPDAAFRRLPIIDDRLLALAPYMAAWFDARNAMAAENLAERVPDLRMSRAAMLVIAGWNDIFVEGSLELFAAARARNNPLDRLVVGPWSHGNPKDWQGDFWHGYGASTQAVFDLQLEFLAAAMTGQALAGPRVRYFRTGSNTWHGAEDWPLPGTTQTALHLAGDILSPSAPLEPQPRSWLSDPADPVPTCGGATFLPGLLLGRNSGQKAQAAIEARPDVVSYTSAPLEHPMEVTGCVKARIRVKAETPSADFALRLCEVWPDGKSVGLVDGIRRWLARGDDAEDIEVTLGHIGHLLAAGNRVRLQVAGSNFPRFDRNPQTGADPAYVGRDGFVSARLTVLSGVLMLPTRDQSRPELVPLGRGTPPDAPLLG